MNYYETANVGKAKYVVSFHDGVKTHADGSKFYDIRIFTNKREKDAFIRQLARAGYAPKERLEATREALRTFSRLERKNCLAYEFVALKLGCSPDQASKLVIQAEAEKLGVCAECREELTSMRGVRTAKGGALFHGRCWRNDR